MATFVLLPRPSSGAIEEAGTFSRLNQQVLERVRQKCHHLRGVGN